MKYIVQYDEILKAKNPDEVFQYLIDSLKVTNTSWEYFVNWEKILKKIKEVEITLNILNYLIGKDNIEQEFLYLVKKYPEIISIIPFLIACRTNKFYILTDYGYDKFEYKKFNFNKKKTYTDEEYNLSLDFVKKTGFLDILSNKKIKNVIDYFTGVEVGLDTNGRKNRGGTIMENIVLYFVKDICLRNNFEYIKEGTATHVKEKWNIDLKVDKSSRRIDFIINTGKKLYLIETNFYGGGGSKLKSTAGEYKAMYDFWKKDNKKFIWITDGIGWKTTQRPLRETFDYIEFMLNLEMVQKKILEDILVNNY